jgi:putative N6-adenine-specific DNA methylase
MNPNEYLAITFRGLEGVLAQEIADLGGSEIRTDAEMVRFKGDKTLLYKANIHLRTAIKVLQLFAEFNATNADEVYDALVTRSWENVLMEKQTFNIHTEVNSEQFKSSSLVGYRVKDAIVDCLEKKNGKRPSVRLTNPDIVVYVHVIDNQCLVSIDSSGEPLSNRGYRTSASESATNEVLAAGLLMLAGWNGQTNFVDPMCGSGTFLIEAALIALNIPPGIYRKGFAFENWSDFDPELLEHLLNDETEERPFNYKIMGSDSSPLAIATAERTIKNASLTNHIEVKTQPIQKMQQAPLPGLLVTYPPTGDRMKPADMFTLFDEIGERFKHALTGYNAWVFSSREDVFEHIRLRSSERYDVRVNNQNCEFRRYELFRGKPSFSDTFSKTRR